MKPYGENRTPLTFIHTPEEYEANRRVSLGFILDANHPNASDDSILFVYSYKK